MRERESLTSITRKRVLNRFDHRLHSHGAGAKKASNCTEIMAVKIDQIAEVRAF